MIYARIATILAGTILTSLAFPVIHSAFIHNGLGAYMNAFGGGCLLGGGGYLIAFAIFWKK